MKLKKNPPTYTERYRPQYHFTPPSAWMNDPNGLVYYEGEYHLFYQHYPEDTVWGPMHWGHAVSNDLLHWEHLPIALSPDALGYIFSGSVVVDWKNSSGYGSKDHPPMVAIFTYHDPKGEAEGAVDFQTQGIAYSLDKGRTWTKFKSNPVLENPGIKDFRDPKVMWHESSQRWIMSLAVKDHITFYSSSNLIDWTLESSFGAPDGAQSGVWECPDLFPLHDQNGNERWVLLVSINPGGPQGGSATQYFVGDFDGKTFLPQEDTIRWMDWGADNYAAVSFSDVPESDGRRLLIGWMSNWEYANQVPTSTWRSAMTLPRSLSLHQKANGEHLLTSAIIGEIDQLLGAAVPLNLKSEEELPTQQLKLNFQLPKSENWSVALKNSLGEVLHFSTLKGHLIIDRLNAGDVSFNSSFAKKMKLPITDIQPKNLEIYIDHSSVELVVNQNRLIATNLIYPTAPLLLLETKNITEGSYQKIKGVWGSIQ